MSWRNHGYAGIDLKEAHRELYRLQKRAWFYHYIGTIRLDIILNPKKFERHMCKIDLAVSAGFMVLGIMAFIMNAMIHNLAVNYFGMIVGSCMFFGGFRTYKETREILRNLDVEDVMES